MIKFNGTNWEEVVEELGDDTNDLKKAINDWLDDAELEGPLKIGDSEIKEDGLVDFMIENDLLKNDKMVMTSENGGDGSGFNVEKVGERDDFHEGFDHEDEDNPHSNSAHEEDIGDIPVEDHDHNTQHHHLGAAEEGHDHENDYEDALPRVNEAYETDEIEWLDLEPDEEILIDEEYFSIPVGTIVWYAGEVNVDEYEANDSIFENFMVCNGASISENDYDELYDVIGNIYGSQPESFRLPNLLGYFVKGATINIGGKYEDTLEHHNHTNLVGRDTYRSQSSGGSDRWVNTDRHRYTDPVGSETRPKNINLIPIIKYKEG